MNIKGHRWWTPEEKRFLKKQAAKRLSWKIIAENFNQHFGLSFSVDSIRRVSHYFGITNKRGAGGHSEIGSEIKCGRRIFVKIKNRPSKWQAKHHFIYERAHGVKLKNNECVIFADSNRLNFDVDNLIKVSRRELTLMALNGFLSDNADVTKVGKSIADIRILIAKRKKQLQQRSKK